MPELLDSTVSLGNRPPPSPGSRSAGRCFHCGEPCRDGAFSKQDRLFCCHGCLLVHELLAQSGLAQFYDLSPHPGVRIKAPANESAERWAYLDEAAVQQRLLDFTDGQVSCITFKIPAIHCVACVWLLENLFRLHPGIGEARVNFPRREVAIRFSPGQISLSRLVALLTSIGYEPQLTLAELDKTAIDPLAKRRWLQLGIAGFAFGNIMLFSIPVYFGLNDFHGTAIKNLFGYLSLALAAPVLLYSAGDYWRAAAASLRQRMLTLDVPIALGLAAIYTQSAVQIFSGTGAGYLDSLTGLVFFLLCGRAFQHKTHERLLFDRDYKCFFPLSVRRKTANGSESVALSQLKVGDRLLLRNRELIPADARLISGSACIDYSFVTGEAEPVTRRPGEHLYAGGQQLGSTIEVETLKPVSQSYLTSLWNHETFQKERGDNLNTLTNRYSRRFTLLVLAVAVGAALAWAIGGQPLRGLKAFTSVLIVACPCALALAAPFALGTAQRWLGRIHIYLKNVLVLERLARVDTIVFDKTGTLTSSQSAQVNFHPAAVPLSAEEVRWLSQLVEQSTHPHSVRLAEFLRANIKSAIHEGKTGLGRSSVVGFTEQAGLGVSGNVDGHELCLGSRQWLEQSGIAIPPQNLPAGSASYVAVDGTCRGAFILINALRPELAQVLPALNGQYKLALLSGDNERERERFSAVFGPRASLHFNQSPLDKLAYIRDLQASGKRVLMVGDGLNDAGALKQSDVGAAVVEQVGAFSPASDIILASERVAQLPQLLRFARTATRVVRWSFGISALYNLVGISIAAAGLLSPVVCAILMPLSSISVVLFACGMTNLAAYRIGFGRGKRAPQSEQNPNLAHDPPTSILLPQPTL